MISVAEAVHNLAIAKKAPKHMRVKGNGRPGQKFSLTRLEALCNQYNIDPAEQAIKGLIPALSPELGDKERADIALKLMEYTYAKRKSVEVTGEDGGPVELVVTWAAKK